MADSSGHCFETFTIKNGLSQGMVRGVFHDKEGFMWFCTKDGLNKYDGYHVTVYRNIPADPHSLPDNYVTTIAEDENGNFWVGTNTKGMCMFDRTEELFYPVQAGNLKLNTGDVRYLRCQNGKLVVFASDVAIYEVINPKKAAYKKDGVLKLKLITSDKKLHTLINQVPASDESISVLPDNSFWMCLPDTFFCFSPRNGYENWTVSRYLPSCVGMNSKEYCVVNQLKDSNKLLFASGKHISLFNKTTGKIEFEKDMDNHERFDLIKQDASGNFFFFNNESIHYFNVDKLSLKKIGDIPGLTTMQESAFDYSGVLWVGTAGQGVIRYDGRKDFFHTYKVPPLLLGVDSNNNFLINLKDRPAIFNPDNGLIKKVNLSTAFVKKEQYTLKYIHNRKSDDFWFKINGNPVSYNLLTGEQKEYKLPQWPAKSIISDLFMDNSGTHWLLMRENGNRPKLYAIDAANRNDSGYYFPIKTGLNEYSFISDFWQDRAGIFWFGTVHGLFSFDLKTNKWRQWKNVPANNTSLSADIIFSLCPDPKEPQKYLWIGTNGGGLDRFEFATGICTHYTEKDGLPNNVVYGILDDEYGNLWLSTNRGLSCFDPNAPGNAVGKFRNFTEDDGLAGDEFNRYEFIKLKNGDLAFGGVKGLTIFKPSEVLKKEPVPNIVLTGLSVFNKPVDYKADTGIINKPIGYASTITLPFDRNMFTIEFAALDFAPAGKKHYKYLLENFNKEWIDNGTRNNATFTNLDPGKYTFHVTGCNRDGVWSDRGATINIIIMPPWWATWWFRTLAVIAVMGALYGFYRYRLYQALKIQALRNDIASDLHDEIGSTLSSVSIASTIMQNKIKGTAPELSPILQQISANTDNMMEAMSDIVWAINTKNDNFENVISRMNAFAAEILEPLDCAIHFDLGPGVSGLSLDMGQRKNCYLIFKEAVNNAAKYSGCKNVTIGMELGAGRKLILKVRDDGKGFDNIIDANEKEAPTLGGNGLINMRKRAAELKGTLTFNAASGKGTEVILEFLV